MCQYITFYTPVIHTYTSTYSKINIVSRSQLGSNDNEEMWSDFEGVMPFHSLNRKKVLWSVQLNSGPQSRLSIRVKYIGVYERKEHVKKKHSSTNKRSQPETNTKTTEIPCKELDSDTHKRRRLLNMLLHYRLPSCYHIIFINILKTFGFRINRKNESRKVYF